MKEHPGFRVVRETPYGPIIERNPDLEPESLEPDDAEETESPGRRNFLQGAAALATGAVGAILTTHNIFNHGKDTSTEVSEEVSLDQPEVLSEHREAGPTFANEVAGYKALAELRKNEVVFVDSSNRPVGQPVEFKDYVGKKRQPDGTVVDYLYSPGKLNEVGLPEAGIAKEWLDYVQARVQRAHPHQKIAGRHNVVADFKKALDETDEPELVAGIASGAIVRYADIVDHFAEKPVLGAEQMTRKDYVQNEVKFKPWDERQKTGVPPKVESELRRVLPGLCAQESKFNNGLTSSSGAKGIFQFMPKTFEQYGGRSEDYSSLRTQVEIAGQFLSDLYYQVRHHIGEAALRMLRLKYSSEEEFERDLLVPLMINSYNAGAARLGEAARLYCARTPVEKIPAGKDLFLAIAEFAERAEDGKYLAAYSKEAREYVPRIYAQAEVLNGAG